jgi:hypothetical protein
MSHNVTLSDVKLKDMNLLGNIVRDMSQGQAKLVNPASNFRTYRGQPTGCDAKIVMPGKHDVGLKRNSDGSFSPVFDPYAMTPVFRAPGGQNMIGGLLREYALQEAEYEAAQRGFSAQRVEGEKGVITLELTAAS